LNSSDYWLWSGTTGTIPYKNGMPREIVDIFERHGFIWGGKWYHYDTMHFEYRPELFSR
jgi:D-alanyl-D-alanine carboxypeptidase